MPIASACARNRARRVVVLGMRDFSSGNYSDGVQMRYELRTPVYFVGFMGAGKTTLTRKLARMLGLASADIDRSIERETGHSIKELFSQMTEGQFRELEAGKLEQFAAGEPLFISCGGGLVEGERSRDIIKNTGFCVHMFVSPDESADRISNHATRPFFETMDSVRTVNSRRAPLYEDIADATVDTTGKKPHEVAVEVRDLLLKEGVLCQRPR